MASSETRGEKVDCGQGTDSNGHSRWIYESVADSEVSGMAVCSMRVASAHPAQAVWSLGACLMLYMLRLLVYYFKTSCRHPVCVSSPNQSVSVVKFVDEVSRSIRDIVSILFLF